MRTGCSRTGPPRASSSCPSSAHQSAFARLPGFCWKRGKRSFRGTSPHLCPIGPVVTGPMFHRVGPAGIPGIMDFDASYAIKLEDGKNKGEYTVDVSSLAELKGRYLLVGTTSSLHLSMVGGKFIKQIGRASC